MKSGIFLKWSVGLALSALPLAGGSVLAETNPPPAGTAAILSAGTNVAPATTNLAEPPEVVTAEATPVETAKPLPPDLKPSSPTAEVIRLANSGVDVGVMLAYVTNSPSTFNLTADEIIYLNDLGVPGTVVTAMIQRDEALKTANPIAAASPPPASETPAPMPVTEPAAPTAAEATPPPPEETYATAPLTPPAGTDVSYSSFYGDLAPYGTWVNVDGYGRCWQPSVVMLNPGWQPYFDSGHWVYTDLGWYWLSDYSWGWAPFHYGRWFRHYRLGWCWAPDLTWGPAWVSWRYSDAYCGWAPLAPGCIFTVGIGVTFHGHHYRGHDDWCGPRNYHFVAWDHFHDRHYRGHALAPHEAERAFSRTVRADRVVVHDRTVINQGLPAARVASATHREVTKISLHQANTARPTIGRAERLDPDRRTLTVYRPPAPGSTRGSGTTVTRSGSQTAQRRNVGDTTAANTRQSPAVSGSGPTPLRMNSQDSRRIEQSRETVQTPARSATGNTATRTGSGAWNPGTASTARPAPVIRERNSSGAVTAPAVPQRAPSVARQNQATPWANPVAQNETARPSWNQAQPAPQAEAARPNVWQNRQAAPTPRQYVAPAQPQPSYQAPVRAAPEVPRYSPPAYTPPPRSYSAPAYSPPPAAARPSYSEAPRYSAPAQQAPRSYSAPSAPPSRAPDSGSRPAPSSNGGNNGGGGGDRRPR